MQVIAANMPYKIFDRVYSVAMMRTHETRPSGSHLLLETYCAEIPGGVVAHTSKDIDTNGRLTRRSTLELLEYGIASTEASSRRVRWFRRRVPR
jgi:hypothetical protein